MYKGAIGLGGQGSNWFRFTREHRVQVYKGAKVQVDKGARGSGVQGSIEVRCTREQLVQVYKVA